MNTIILITAIIAVTIALYALVRISMFKTQIFELESDLLDIARRTRLMKYDIDLLALSQQETIPTKRKRGRPRKNVTPKIIHQLHGEQ